MQVLFFFSSSYHLGITNQVGVLVRPIMQAKLVLLIRQVILVSSIRQVYRFIVRPIRKVLDYLVGLYTTSPSYLVGLYTANPSYQSPRLINFGSSRNSLNTTLRPNLRPNSDDSLCHVICQLQDLRLDLRNQAQ